uniref:Uncharacterized protein n=1 Tax=Alexandrium monilatum TaxID=311494 RepID=A0A7S4RKJ3_9DINO
MEPAPGSEKAANGRLHGSLTEADFLSGAKQTSVSTGRHSINLCALTQAMMVPWLMFVIICAVLTFSLPLRALWLVLVVLLVVRVVSTAFDAWRGRSQKHGYRFWLLALFMLVTALAASIAGIVVGMQNSAMRGPYDIFTSMGMYFDVDPDEPRISYQIADAGRVFFLPGARVETQMAKGFRSGSTYCVAPVSLGRTRPRATYAFWAVGVDCCPGSGSDIEFRCGDVSNPRAYAGMRLMDEGQRPFFRLAVQQAEATYKIRAPHPIFLHWVQDPIAEIHAYQDEGCKNFLLSICSFFVFQLFAVAAFALLSKTIC